MASFAPMEKHERQPMRFSASLLVGGESLRMGRDKATLLFEGRPLWQHQLDLLRTLNPTELFLSGRKAPSWRPPDVKFVSDASPSRGPLSGLASSLGAISTPHLLVLAVDLPQMTAAFLAKISQQVATGCGVLPLLRGRAEPLAAIYPREALPDFARALAGSDFSLQHVAHHLLDLGRLQPWPVDRADEFLFHNVNRPGDLAALA